MVLKFINIWPWETKIRAYIKTQNGSGSEGKTSRLKDRQGLHYLMPLSLSAIR
jgi:hypothetical protein